MANVIVVLILVIVVGLACRYIYKKNKNGIKCMGCPYAGSCSNKDSCPDNK